MKAADLREKSVEDLQELAKTLARDVFQNRLKNFTNRLDDTSTIRKTRRDFARVATLLRERERERELGAAVVATSREGDVPIAKSAAEMASAKRSSSRKSEVKQP